ncbi:hypothetical protein C0992_005803 [Termitomyces sp. T32_za158]|nr:hypothetical protein C0992_005803 [Termitomyces sp. T32_za158]
MLLNIEVNHLRQLTTTLAASSKSNPTISAPEPCIYRTRSSTRFSEKSLPKLEDQNDHPNVPFWAEEGWLSWVKNEKNEGQKPDRFGFITDTNGQAVSKKRLKKFGEVSRPTWTEIRWLGEHPATWKKKSNKAMHYYYHIVGTTFPEFLLAESYWKIKRYATFKYPDWIHNYQEHNDETSCGPSKRCSENLDDDPINRKPKKKKCLSSPPQILEINEDEAKDTTASTSKIPAP